MNRSLALLPVVLLSGLSSTASAHALHGAGAGFSAGFVHPFLGLDHVLAMAAIGICTGQLRSRAPWRMTAAVAIAIITGALLARSVAAAPGFEILVATSVCALGLLVVCAGKVAPAYAVAIAAFFALVHGAAHGAEQPNEFSTMAYLAGVLLASTALQALGLAMAFVFKQKARLVGLPLIAAGAWLVIGA
jgi:urease accessory protein